MEIFKNKFLAASLMAGLLGGVSTAAYAEYNTDRTSLVAPVHVGSNKVNFIVRGSSIEILQAFKMKNF